ncbi:hypothetical protein MVEN_00696000 [Mycena venus]|uniref:Uncharacterized protein n=1 Tax=Mycena venus TaxID=2733690 RepID=A0A8H6YIN9_9AGAR|nr:hypothetical protein MVEN_00696000 [Mycena venus]
MRWYAPSHRKRKQTFSSLGCDIVDSSSHLITQTLILLFSVHAARISTLARRPHSRPRHSPWCSTRTRPVRRGPRPAHTRTAGAYTPLFILASPICAHPQAPACRSRLYRCPRDGNVRLVSIHNRHTLAHDSRRPGGISLTLSERAYPGNDRCARSARAAPRPSPSSRPPPSSSPSLGAQLPPSCAGGLHAAQEACSFMHTSTLFHFRYVECPPFAFRDLDGYEGAAGAYTDLDGVNFFGSSSPFFICIAPDFPLPSTPFLSYSLAYASRTFLLDHNPPSLFHRILRTKWAVVSAPLSSPPLLSSLNFLLVFHVVFSFAVIR